MSIIKLGETSYISESISDDSIPARNYDDLIDISKSKDPDQWFSRIETEWPDLPEEIKSKILDKTGEYINSMVESIRDDDSDLIINENVDSQGNEIYDFNAGRAKVKSMSDSSLSYVRDELIDVIQKQEDMRKHGYKTTKLGYYWDEYWTVIDEITKRNKKGANIQIKPWQLYGKTIDDSAVEKPV